MNGRLANWGLLAAAILQMFIFLAPRLDGAILEVYDEDSLVHLSTDVIEAEIIGLDPAVKVAVVHKGGLKVGQEVSVEGLSFYQKSAKLMSWEALAKGDRLVMFLATQGERYQPLSGGLRLMAKDRLLGFSQEMNPGPYVARLPSEGAEAPSESSEEFRKRFPGVVRKTQEWGALLEGELGQPEVERLMKLLAERAPRTDWNSRDHFSERICDRFVETKDPAILSRALLVAGREFRLLADGFDTSAGRDFLLARVTDVSLPLADRMKFSYALTGAGSRMQASDGTPSYLTRIAKAARAVKGEEALGVSLVGCVGQFASSLMQNRPEALMPDLRSASEELEEFYREQPSEEFQFVIESALMHDPSAYEKLGSACGPLVSILRPADPAQMGKSVKGRLAFEYEYSSLRVPADAKVRPSLVLMHQATHRKHVVPSDIEIEGRSSGGGAHSIALPEDLPAGRYQIHLEVDGGEDLRSRGHFFTAEL